MYDHCSHLLNTHGMPHLGGLQRNQVKRTCGNRSYAMKSAHFWFRQHSDSSGWLSYGYFFRLLNWCWTVIVTISVHAIGFGASKLNGCSYSFQRLSSYNICIYLHLCICVFLHLHIGICIYLNIYISKYSYI